MGNGQSQWIAPTALPGYAELQLCILFSLTLTPTLSHKWARELGGIAILRVPSSRLRERDRVRVSISITSPSVF